MQAQPWNCICTIVYYAGNHFLVNACHHRKAFFLLVVCVGMTTDTSAHDKNTHTYATIIIIIYRIKLSNYTHMHWYSPRNVSSVFAPFRLGFCHRAAHGHNCLCVQTQRTGRDNITHTCAVWRRVYIMAITGRGKRETSIFMPIMCAVVLARSVFCWHAAYFTLIGCGCAGATRCCMQFLAATPQCRRRRRHRRRRRPCMVNLEMIYPRERDGRQSAGTCVGRAHVGRPDGRRRRPMTVQHVHD